MRNPLARELAKQFETPKERPLEGMRARRLVKTLDACPSQWEGNLEDMRGLYVRFRHGLLAVYVEGEVIWTQDFADDVALSFMDTETMLRLTGLTLMDGEGSELV